MSVRALTDAQEAELVAYRATHSIADTAARFGVAMGTVTAICKRHGVAPRTHPRRDRRPVAEHGQAKMHPLLRDWGTLR